jgi:hypothetical protein
MSFYEEITPLSHMYHNSTKLLKLSGMGMSTLHPPHGLAVQHVPLLDMVGEIAKLVSTRPL